MRIGFGVLIGLIIGAAIAFAGIAVADLATRSTCRQELPSDCDVAIELPPSAWLAEPDASALPLAGGEVRAAGLAGGACGSLLIWLQWQRPGRAAVSGFGLELAITPRPGGEFALHPAAIRFGPLRLPLVWLPPECAEKAQPALAAASGRLKQLGLTPNSVEASAGALRLCLSLPRQ
jgi:hypothetical protein